MSTDSLAVALKVLQSSRLESGVNRLVGLGRDRPPGLHAFRAESVNVDSSLKSVLAILEGKNDDAKIESARAFIECHTSRDDPVFLFAEDLADLPSDLEINSLRIPIKKLDALFSTLFEIPPEFLSANLSSNMEDFASREYRARFQSRMGRIVNSPLEDHGFAYKSGDVINVHDYFVEWSRAMAWRKPLLLLGDRGAGKTWQLFNFCDVAYSLHTETPWSRGPAFYLHLKEVREYFDRSSQAMPSFAQLILRRFPAVRVLWDAPMFESFLEAGHVILCLDSVDEIFQHPSSRQVREHIRRISSALSADTRFLMTCRTTHFDGIEDLLSMEAWPGTTIESSYEIVELLPFDDEKVDAYLTSAGISEGGSVDRLIDENVDLRGGWESEEREMILTTVHQPAMLAEFVKLLQEGGPAGGSGALTWLKEILDRAVLEFNIERRTSDYFIDEQSGDVIDFELDDRLIILEELAWYMAERGWDTIDIRKLPRRMAMLCRVEAEELQRDIRSQTLFELCGERGSSLEGHIRFTLRLPEVASQASSSIGVPGVAGKAASLQLALAEAPVTATSVAGAYFSARYLARMFHIGSLMREELSRPGELAILGVVPIGPVCACMLAGLLEGLEVGDNSLYDLLSLNAAEFLKEESQAEVPKLLHPRLRFLINNLKLLGVDAAQAIRGLAGEI